MVPTNHLLSVAPRAVQPPLESAGSSEAGAGTCACCPVLPRPPMCLGLMLAAGWTSAWSLREHSGLLSGLGPLTTQQSGVKGHTQEDLIEAGLSALTTATTCVH